MTLGADLLLVSVGLPALSACGYLLLLTLASQRQSEQAPGEPTLRFRFIVPAHDEAAGIAATVTNLLGVDYPRELFDVLVVADNCTDDTAARARSAGALVLERQDQQLRGKGYALAYAFEQLPENVDAVAIVDADTLVSPNLLQAFAARVGRDAHAVQADYAVRNPEASWRTRLIAIAFGSFHIVRSRGRERLGLSAGLRGNGMCFTRTLLAKVPHDAFSVVEDVEYGIRLGEAGYRVHYADEAHVYGEMVSSGGAARSQRQRWEDGRRALRRKYAPRLLRAALRRSDPVLFDLALDLLVPPMSRLATYMGLGLGSSIVAGLPISLVSFGLGTGALSAYVLRGWGVSGTGARGLADLAMAPAYVAWKASLRVVGSATKRGEWVRTRRERTEPG